MTFPNEEDESIYWRDEIVDDQEQEFTPKGPKRPIDEEDNILVDWSGL